MVDEKPGVLLAKGLLAIEPEKITGGSPERQGWIGLVTMTLSYLIENKHEYKSFKNLINGLPEDWENENY